MLTQRKIIHIDCDCFFAAVEMRDNPALSEIPLAIGGSVDRRGVISTCNYPARQYGVRSAMATAEALRRCPQLTLLPGNMEKYRQVSSQVMTILQQFSAAVEPISIDEAYLDVTGSRLMQGSATRIANAIRETVKQQLGITVSAGVAPNRFLAKIASDWRKPDGLFVIKPGQVVDFLSDLPVGKLPGVGEKTAQKLAQWGITNGLELRQQAQDDLIDRFGKFGQRLYELARGIDERPVGLTRIRKSVSVEHTFAHDLPDYAACLEQLPLLIERLYLRSQKHLENRGISAIVVKVKFADFSQTTVEHQISLPTQSLYEALLLEAYSRGQKPVRLLGVGFKLLHPEQTKVEQLSLWPGVTSISE
ncbi:DNA polymerase IV [Neptuniibacter sp. CAU 1671]|uniref:DNA polymerase IV n=1 Tax=Neptuniibacter sp. CAU 1671 TaxID=3032593 RepID=UPI0023DBC8DA|nr:DNA polymerase IV [Neptuniibacter sp. CAU 1671]MDF2181111.1 DNA polymerase IV [Neptuniibacter sp. CAU 1671]